MISAFFSQRFTALGDDGGSYWIRQDDSTNTIWWLGIHPDRRWAHVYRGRLISGDATDRWEGEFIDVPKGTSCGHGPLDWEVAALGGLRFLQKTRGPGFGARRLVPPPFSGAVPSDGVARLSPGFVGTGLDNLTGVWIGDDGGTYYIRQVAENGHIAWVGEHPEAMPGSDATPGLRWVNVLMGERRRNMIIADWSDVPKGEINQAGTMRIVVDNADSLTIVSKTGGFGGNRFSRVADITAQLQFVSLTVVDQQEWFLEADEPYFLAIVALMDGATVDLTAPSTAAGDYSRSLVAPNLGSNLGAGTVISLRGIAPIDIPIKPVRGDTGSHPVLGLALRGAERDWSSDQWRADRLANWIAAGGNEIDRNMRRGTLNFRTDIARWHETFTWRDEDDLFGLATRTFTFSEIVGMAGTTTRLTFRLRGGDVQYDVAADLSVSGVRGGCRP